MFFSLLAAALADGARASAQRASVRELQARLGAGSSGPTGLTARMLWVLTQFPDPFGAQVVSWLLGHPPFGRSFVDYTLPGGRALVEEEARSMGLSPVEAMRRYLEAHPLSSTPYDGTIPLLVRWIHAELRTLGPVKIPVAALFSMPYRTVSTFDVQTMRKIAAFYTWKRATGRVEGETTGHEERAAKWQELGLGGSLGFASFLGQRMGTLFSDPMVPPPASLTGEELLLAAWFYALSRPLPGLLDWIVANPSLADRMSLEEALRASARWHRAQAKAARAGAAAEGTVVAVLPNDLGTIRELAPADLPAESKAMGHCVGNTPVYAQGIREGMTRIFSVRDATGAPVFTIEAQNTWNGGARTVGWNILQMKGEKNRIPGLSVGATRNRPAGTISMTAMWLRGQPKLVQRRDLAIGEAALQALPGLGVEVPEDPRRAITGDLEVLYLARLGELPPAE